MKLLHLKDQTEKHEVKAIDGLTISVKVYDIQKQWSDLQNLVQDVAKDHFEGIVVSAKLGGTSDYWGLEFCMRLRLSYSLIGVKAFTTLFVYTESPVEELMKEQTEQKTQPTATLLLTRGTFAFDSFDFFTVISTPPSNYNQLNEDNYKTAFLDVIKINRPPEIGHHSLANLLGATRLAEITGNRDAIDTNTAISAKKTDLYFKFKTDLKTNVSGNFSKKTIPAKGKQILLIDDKENFGWSDVLSKVFKDAFFDFVEAGENFVERAEKKAFEEVASFPKWDLILLDLRLEEKEDSDEMVNNHAGLYSGAKLLKKLKERNRGIQIITFTASNKAWNLRQLISSPYYVDGYFIKEPPENDLEGLFSLENLQRFVNDVQECLMFTDFKKIVAYCNVIKRHLETVSNVGGGNGFQALFKLKLKNEIDAQINQAIELLSYSKSNENNYSWAFLSFYKVFELINDYFIEFNTSVQTLVFKENNQPIKECKYENQSNRYLFQSVAHLEPLKTSTSVKLFNVFDKCLLLNPIANINLYKSIYKHQVNRRKFIHPNDLNDYRKLTIIDCCQIANDLKTIIIKIK